MIHQNNHGITKVEFSVLFLLVLFISITGVTYAYFVTLHINRNMITGHMASVDLRLSVRRVFPQNEENTSGVMVPQLSSSSALSSALEGGCVDANRNIACQVYAIDVENRNGSATQVIDGKIYFYSDSSLTTDIHGSMPNLKWKIVSSVDENQPANSLLGNEAIHVANATGISFSHLELNKNSKVTYYMLIWVDEIQHDQDDKSSHSIQKRFYGKINFDASNGVGLTATFGS